MKRRICGMVLAVIMLLAGCGASTNSIDLMQDIEPLSAAWSETLSGGEAAVVTDFGVKLLQQTVTEENTLVSPVSVLMALAMTANGAKGETLAQMEAVLGMKTEQLNTWMHSYLESLPDTKKSSLKLANFLGVRKPEQDM